MLEWRAAALLFTTKQFELIFYCYEQILIWLFVSKMNSKHYIPPDGHSRRCYYCFKLSLNEDERRGRSCNANEMQYNKQVPSDIWTFWQWHNSLKQSDWSAHNVAVFSWMGFPFCTQKSIPCASSQTNDLQFSAGERRPATPLYCFVLLLYRVSMAMCVACIHGKSFISFVSLEQGTRGITEPQDTQSQTSLRTRPSGCVLSAH